MRARASPAVTAGEGGGGGGRVGTGVALGTRPTPAQAVHDEIGEGGAGDAETGEQIGKGAVVAVAGVARRAEEAHQLALLREGEGRVEHDLFLAAGDLRRRG